MSALGASLLARAAAPLAALLLAALAWQTARIEGWPLTGGGFKAKIAALETGMAAAELARARQDAMLLAAQIQRARTANDAARAHEETKRGHDAHLRKVTESVHVRIGETGNRLCVLPWGAVRLLDAAASGADPDAVAAHIAPGQPDDAASDITLSETVALLAANLAAARTNADQLRQLQAAVGE